MLFRSQILDREIWKTAQSYETQSPTDITVGFFSILVFISFRLPCIILSKGGAGMSIQDNMADMLRAKRKLSGQSIEEWAEELGIAQSTLQEYMKGNGNPTVKMVEHLADKLGIDPIALMSGNMEPEQRQTVLLLLDTIQAVSVLPKSKRLRFAELFLELTQLWEENIE